MVTPGYLRRYALSWSWRGGTWGGNLLYAVSWPRQRNVFVWGGNKMISCRYLVDASIYSNMRKGFWWLLKNGSWRMLKGPRDWWAWCWDLHFLGVKKSVCGQKSLWVSSTRRLSSLIGKTWKTHTHTQDSRFISILAFAFLKTFHSDPKVNELYCENPFNSHCWLLHPYPSDSYTDTTCTKGGHE